MADFWATVTSFPVVVFTLPLCFIVFYWLLVAFGLLDLGEADGSDGLSDMDGGAEGLSGLLATLGLGGVPFSIVLSLITSQSWLLTSIVTALFFPHIHSPVVRLLLGLLLIAVVLALVIPITANILRPIRPFFRTYQGTRKATLVGKDCIVKTLSVTPTFGQGEVIDGEAGILINIVANTPNNIKKGDVVWLLEYDAQLDVYSVAKPDE